MSKSCFSGIGVAVSSTIVEPSGGASGQASDIAIHAKEILRVREVLTGIYQKHCGIEGESVQDGLNRFSASLLRALFGMYTDVDVILRNCTGAGLLHDWWAGNARILQSYANHLPS